MASTADKDRRKNAANLFSSNSRSPSVFLHPFSRLLRAGAVAPCSLSELVVSGVCLSRATTLNRNCLCHIAASNKTHKLFPSFIHFPCRTHSPVDTTQRWPHTQTVKCSVTQVSTNKPPNTSPRSYHHPVKCESQVMFPSTSHSIHVFEVRLSLARWYLIFLISGAREYAVMCLHIEILTWLRATASNQSCVVATD